MSRFGFSTEPSSGGDYLPVTKYDARAGRMFRVDRTQDASGNYVTDQVDITGSFKAVFDFENVETGWIYFAAGAAPDFRLVPMGSMLPDRPTPNHKNGIRFMMKLSQACGGDKQIREIAGTSKAFLSAVEAVFEEYDGARKDNPGKLPVVAMDGATPIKSGTGQKTSTNYVPKFRITGWAPRGDLVFTPKNGEREPVRQGGAPQTPPSTGGTVAPPPAAQKQPEPELEDEFG